MDLRRLRRRRRLTQHDLSRLTGIQQTTLSALELGKTRDPRISTVERLARALHVTEADVLRAVRASVANGAGA